MNRVINIQNPGVTYAAHADTNDKCQNVPRAWFATFAIPLAKNSNKGEELILGEGLERKK